MWFYNCVHAFAGAVLTCALLAHNPGNVGLVDFQLLSSAINCTSTTPVAALAPGGTAVCIVHTAVADTTVLETGGSVLLDYSNYSVSAKGLVSTVAIDTSLSDSVPLSEVPGWTAPVYHAALQLTIDPATCTVPGAAGTQEGTLVRAVLFFQHGTHANLQRHRRLLSSSERRASSTEGVDKVFIVPDEATQFIWSTLPCCELPWLQVVLVAASSQ